MNARNVLTIAFAGMMMVCGALAQDELASAYNELKAAAEGKKPSAEVKKLAEAAVAAVKKNQGAAPADVDKAAWDERVKYAGEIMTQVEYLVYSSATGQPPAGSIELYRYLEQIAPKSKYMGNAYRGMIAAMQQSGQAAQVGPIAEKAAGAFPDDASIQMLAADFEMNRQGADRALMFAKRAAGILDRTPKAPEGIPQGQWDGMKGRAHYYAGLVQGTKRQFAEADKDLRAALPNIKDNASFTANAYYWLGESNYALGRQVMDRAQINQGMKYIEQASTMSGPYRDLAGQRLRAMKQEMGIK